MTIKETILSSAKRDALKAVTDFVRCGAYPKTVYDEVKKAASVSEINRIVRSAAIKYL